MGHTRGNAGRIRLAGQPIYPLAERLVNGMESLIEMMRLRELRETPERSAAIEPTRGGLRYFQLPSLDQIPLSKERISGKSLRDHALRIARMLLLELKVDKTLRSSSLFRFATTVWDRPRPGCIRPSSRWDRATRETSHI